MACTPSNSKPIYSAPKYPNNREYVHFWIARDDYRKSLSLNHFCWNKNQYPCLLFYALLCQIWLISSSSNVRAPDVILVIWWWFLIWWTESNLNPGDSSKSVHLNHSLRTARSVYVEDIRAPPKVNLHYRAVCLVHEQERCCPKVKCIVVVTFWMRSDKYETPRRSDSMSNDKSIQKLFET